MGIDVFLGEQIAEDMGAEFEVVHMDFNKPVHPVEPGTVRYGDRRRRDR